MAQALDEVRKQREEFQQQVGPAEVWAPGWGVPASGRTSLPPYVSRTGCT